MSKYKSELHRHLTAIRNMYASMNPEITERTMPALVLRHGCWWEDLTDPRGFDMGEPKRCFDNSMRLATRCDLLYCQGFVVCHDLYVPIEHAWCVDVDGSIIETTLGPGRAATYAGVVFDPSFALEWMIRGRGQYGFDNLQHDRKRGTFMADAYDARHA
jgi:hypothetical protein